MIRNILIACLLLAGAGNASAALERISLKEGMANGTLEVKAWANGNGYHNKSLHMEITNTGAKAIQVEIDQALIFRPVDTGYQDFVLAGTDLVVVKGKGTMIVEEQVFCGKSHAAAPSRNLTFQFLKQGDEQLVKVMTFINQKKLYDNLGQDAVWALTNRHELNGVFDPARPDLSRELLAYMSKVTGWPIPEYYKLYAHNARGTGPVAEPKALKMLALFDWKLEAPKTLTLGIYNKDGRMVQPVVENKEFGRGGHRVRVEFEAEGAETGMYYIRLMDGAAVMKETAVKVD